MVKSPAILMKVLKTEDLLNDSELNKTTITELVGNGLNVFFGYPKGSTRHDLRIMARFKKKLLIGHPERTNLISISYTSRGREKSARIANAVANVFLAQHLEAGRATTPMAAKWLSDRKNALREHWRQSENSVEKFKAKNNLSYVGGKKLRENHINKLNEQMVLATTKTEAARARFEQVRQLFKDGNYQRLADVVRSDVLTGLRGRYAAASQREASLNTSLLPSHPDLKKVRAETAVLRRQIETEGRRTLNSLDVKFRAASAQEKLIRGNFDKTVRNIQESGSNLVKLKELERTASSGRAIFEAFLNRSNEMLEQTTGQFANYSIVQIAQVPIRPSFPSKLKVLVLAMIGSLAAGIGLAFILETLSNTFRTSQQISDTLKLPALATLPMLTSKDLTAAEVKQRPERLLAHQRGTPFVRRIAALNVSLRLDGSDAPGRLLVVSSALEGEGKTMIAASLAQDASLSGEKVLLIDCNWQNPSLHRIFDAHSCGVITNDHKQNGHSGSPVLHDNVTGLDILPAMAGAGNSVKFGGSEEFTSLLNSARDTYDLIILDTRAVLSDPNSWALIAHADMTLLVVQWDKTRRDVASQALQTLETLEANTIGVVLNGADFRQLAKENENISLVKRATKLYACYKRKLLGNLLFVTLRNNNK